MPKSIERTELAERFGGIVATALGIVLAVTPVALWIAWTATLVVWIMLVAVACAMLLSMVESSLPSSRSQRNGAGGRVVLPEEFIEEVHRLFPLTYHHSRHGATRFQQSMKRMSRLIEGSRPGDSPR